MATVFNSLCNLTFADSNATGLTSFTPGGRDNVNTNASGNQSFAPNVTWAYTEYQNDTLLQQVLWYNTGGLNYSDPSALGYDVCFVPLPSLTQYATERAVNDNGDCSTALNDTCMNAIYSAAKSTALNSSGANVEPQESGIENLCNQIGQAILTTLSTSCSQFFDTVNATNSFPEPLTGFAGNVSYLYSGTPACVIANDTAEITGLNTSSDVYWAVGGQYGPADNSTYDQFADTVLPLITIFLPLLSSLSLDDHTIDEPTSQLTCLRETQISAGSRVPPPIPTLSSQSGPSNSKSGLSGGDIAGIVVGSVVGAALIAAILFFFFWRRRNQRRNLNAAAGPTVHELPGGNAPVEVDSAMVNEAYTQEKETELDSATLKHELSADKAADAELLGDTGHIAELPGDPVPVAHMQAEENTHENR